MWQQLDPLDAGDHEHLLRAVAYAMKRRHMEHGEVIATGVLASPWAEAQTAQASAPTVTGPNTYRSVSAGVDPGELLTGVSGQA